MPICKIKTSILFSYIKTRELISYIPLNLIYLPLRNNTFSKSTIYRHSRSRSISTYIMHKEIILRHKLQSPSEVLITHQ